MFKLPIVIFVCLSNSVIFASYWPLHYDLTGYEALEWIWVFLYLVDVFLGCECVQQIYRGEPPSSRTRWWCLYGIEVVFNDIQYAFDVITKRTTTTYLP